MAIAPSKARTGFGSKFALAASAAALAAGGEGVDWAEVNAMKPPSDTWDTAEVTHFQSADQRREWIKTLIDSGEADMIVNLVPGGPTDLAMQSACASELAQYYTMGIPKGGGQYWKITGLCLVVGYDRETPIGEAMKATARIRYTGTRTEQASS